nr:hypothetical protein [Gorillibacterium massiliense]
MDCGFQIFLLGIAAKEQYFTVWLTFQKLFGELDAVHPWHFDIGQHDIGFKAVANLKRFQSIFGNHDSFDAKFVPFDKMKQTFAGRLFIVHDQKTDHHAYTSAVKKSHFHYPRFGSS